MAAEATVVNLVQQIQVTNNKTEALEHLKVAICAINPSELSSILPNISINNVFNCLNTSDVEQQQACAEVLSRMLSSLEAPVVLELYHGQILAWLRVDEEKVQALCLPLLTRLTRESPESVTHHPDVISAVVELLRSDSLDLGPGAAAVLTHLGQDVTGLQMLFSEEIVRQMNQVMLKSDICRFRVYQIAADLSTMLPVALEACVRSGLLQQLINEVARDDILVQLNAIELLSDLARSQHGLAHLDSSGVVGQMEGMIAGLQDHPMAGLLLPGLVKFFGGLARSHPKEVLNKFDKFVRLVLSNVSGGDPALQPVSVETVAFIASTPEGKLAFEKIGNPMTECIQAIGSQIKTGVTETRVRALRAMASLVFLQVEHQTVELLDLTKRWFNTSMSQPLHTVWSIAQQPFDDLRVPALHALHSLALCPWGQQLMNSEPGFREYLLDRSTETSTEGKTHKFELVNILAHSPTVEQTFGVPYRVKLAEHFNQGPFFVMVESQVALEGE